MDMIINKRYGVFRVVTWVYDHSYTLPNLNSFVLVQICWSCKDCNLRLKSRVKNLKWSDGLNFYPPYPIHTGLFALEQLFLYMRILGKQCKATWNFDWNNINIIPTLLSFFLSFFLSFLEKMQPITWFLQYTSNICNSDMPSLNGPWVSNCELKLGSNIPMAK